MGRGLVSAVLVLLPLLAAFLQGARAAPVSGVGKTEPGVSGQPTTEALLAQVREVQANPSGSSSSVIRDLEAQLRGEADAIRRLDDSDRASLPDQIAEAQEGVDVAEKILGEADERVRNATVLAEKKREACSGLTTKLGEAQNEHSRAEDGLQVHTDLLNSEESKVNETLEAIDRDLQVLDVVEKELAKSVAEASLAASLPADPLKHQVSALVDKLRQELLSSRHTIEVEFRVTEQRLHRASLPAQDNLHEAKEAVGQLSGLQQDCLSQVEALERAAEEERDTKHSAASELQEASEALHRIQPQFEERHQARVKRIDFLLGVVEELRRLTQAPHSA